MDQQELEALREKMPIHVMTLSAKIDTPIMASLAMISPPDVPFSKEKIKLCILNTISKNKPNLFGFAEEDKGEMLKEITDLDVPFYEIVSNPDQAEIIISFNETETPGMCLAKNRLTRRGKEIIENLDIYLGKRNQTIGNLQIEEPKNWKETTVKGEVYKNALHVRSFLEKSVYLLIGKSIAVIA